MRILLSIMAVAIYSLPFSTAHAAGDPVAGKAKAASCEACHGQNSSNPMAPKLAGQPHAYTEQQLINFVNGTRKDPIMSGMAASLTKPRDIKDIAAYYASLTFPKGNHVKLLANTTSLNTMLKIKPVLRIL